MKLDVLYEDNHLLVINKPPGVATMGALPGKPTLAGWAKQYLKQKYDKPGNVYLGIVSRLDAQTSGVIVFARTSKAASRLTNSFQQQTAKKTYWAIVEDALPHESGHLQHWLYKDDAQHRMVALSAHDERRKTKEARLKYRVMGRAQNGALVAIELETGRKHQIRAQFAKIGCPVLGDRKYGSRRSFPDGIALHSQSLKLVHPTQKEELEFTASPPKCWFLDQYLIK